MDTRASRSRRGQALVETALGSLVFVTVLMFGIYFAEVSALTLKVQEAANFALWEATGHVMHNPQNGVFQRSNAEALASAEAAGRYQDFDGRAGRTSGAMTFQLALARATRIQVDCEPTRPAGSDIEILGTRPQDADPVSTALSQSMDTQSDGISCTASTRMRAERLGTFMEPEFFKVSHRRATDQFVVCAAGRASNGRCTRRFFMLLDDWGLSTVAEGRECPLSTNTGGACGNVDYYEWAQSVYRNNGGGGSAGSALMAGVGAEGGVNEDQFFMSFRGQESNYEQSIGGSHAGNQTVWETTPFKASNINPKYDVQRENKWLGGVPH
ncbi:pilus assembly protein [Corallococcus sp. AB011P]|uniref:TadE/TadG family type IV pilus assembly protein n=1 Tax=Corallococcus sp. AB011P TaxID=2316735 RepID=UPI000EA11C54|nr:pilus assembly protein [Corallococcus sp. AB011P]RKG60985.1 pilus assembly protein [Corallococcus sp. AB011P]